MRGNESPDDVRTFDRYRPLLFSIAYRMLGSATDSEDVLQEAYLRWRKVSEEEIQSPKSYLSKVVTRLCIDQLRSARARREEYVGSWLPEPLPTGEGFGADAEHGAPLDETLSMAFLVLLESLSPVERAVFILKEVFDYDYAEISHVVGKGEANCRQVAHRARRSVAARRPRFESSPEEGKRLAESFIEASTSGDMENLLALFSKEIVLYSDGGGKENAPLKPIYGSDKVARFLVAVLAKNPPASVRLLRVNGEPAIAGYDPEGRSTGVVVLEVFAGRAEAMYLVNNPEKLGSIPPEEDAQ